MKTGRYNIFQRILSVAIALVLVVGLLPRLSLPAVAADQEAGLDTQSMVADPHTLDNWQDYYGDNSILPDGTRGTSTWKAGGVWTDKSVFDSAAAFAAAEEDAPADLTVGENHFLVSLSALASNTEVVGQSSTPTDTMLVLDLSNSMDTSQSVPDMVKAANDTIKALLEMNANNRVGVVLYSGNTSRLNAAKASSATVLLSLDRYSAASDGNYLTYTGSSNDTTVSVSSGVKDSNGDNVSASKQTNGATYIQNGLYKAWGEFNSVDSVVVSEGVQAGTQRQPILVLMSDGAPTVATTSYNAVDSSNQGNGGGTNDRIAFLTQLTAAWVKGKVTEKYNNTAMKFYTLGLGTGSSEQATSVLYPAGSNTTITGYWRSYLNTEDGEDVTVGSGNQRITVERDSAVTAMNYVDRYWQATAAADMVAAFREIVSDIQLQTAYSATLVESGETDLDGYITVEDELGSMMQVHDVKGLLLGDVLFTGKEMAQSLDSMSSTEGYGNEFVRTVMERIGTADTSQTQQLIAAAYNAGQLSYDETTGEYSNYIGWYGDADNNYLGFWQESDGYSLENAPEGAAYINKSYGYLGRSHEDSDADMMHIVVMVHTEIATGDQTVLFKVPSSLIPMVTYTVEVVDKEYTLTVKETDPIRLLYEVGLPDDVNSVNLEQKVAEYLSKDEANHIHKDENGNYAFYANGWAADENDAAPDISTLTDAQKLKLTESVAESHFIPNTINERYYIQEDSLVYTYDGSSYVPVTSQPVAGGTYYFARTIVNVTGADGAAEAVTQYEALYPATVANADNFQKNAEGNWEVKAGTIRQTLTDLALAKSENRTGTIGNSDDLWVNITSSDAADYNIYSFLGNNGKLTVAPAQGIKVTKNVTELAEGASADEQFQITVTLDTAESGILVTDGDGNALEDAVISADNKTVTLYLVSGETAYITGLTAGTGYTVTESANEKYTASYTGAAGEVAAKTVKEAVVTNAPIQNGTLYITKEVVHAHQGETFPTDVAFEFQVAFEDAQGNPLAGKTFAISNNYDATITQLTTDANGVITGKLMHGETANIQGIPEGTVVTVTEVNIPENYSVQYRSRNATGLEADTDGTVTIVGNANATVVATNTYTPKSTTVDLDIAGTKNFVAENTDVLPGGSFTFQVQKWNGTGWDTLKETSVTYAAKENGEKTFTIEDVLSGIIYSQAGTYTYQVLEVKGNTANVTYDRSLYTFTVTVTDVNGQLTAVVTDLHNNQITDGSYEVTFENTYHTAPVSIDVVKEIDDTTENPLTSKAGFEFVAVQTDENWAPLTGDAASTLTVYSDGAGDARFAATYNKAGSYYYVVTEQEGSDPGWTYSNAEYKIEVVVTDDGTGDLSATLIVNGVDKKADNTTITFENKYDPEDGEVDLNLVPTVLKKLNGRQLAAGEFTFAIFPDGQSSFESTEGALAVGTNDENGNVDFNKKLSFSQVGTYYYDLVEINGGKAGVTYSTTIYDMVVEVTDNGEGELIADYYFEDAVAEQVTFTNTYTLQPTQVVIDGIKTVDVRSGVKTMNAGDFTFGLYEVVDGVVSSTALRTATNHANGSFGFGAITYDADDLGLHTYVVKEIAPDGSTDGSYTNQGMAYSGQSFEVTVNVTDNGDGTMSTAVTGNGADNISFVNTYNAEAAVPVQITGVKSLSGRDLTADEFRFVLYKTDETFVVTDSTPIVAQNGLDYVTNAVGGSFTVSTGSLDTLGYHYYVLKEMIPAEEDRAAGISYDAGEYQITVQVVDQGRGQMTTLVSVYHPGTPHISNPDVAFWNNYAPEDDELVISGSKQYDGGKSLTGGEFTFALYEGTEPIDTADVNADGTFSFDAITYTADDIGTHTYTVKEVIPADATDNGDGTKTYGSVIYDAKEYTVVVTVADEDKDGALEISKTVDGSAETELKFTNTFVPDPVEYTLLAKKTYDKELKGNDFWFELTGKIGDTQISQEKQNDADGNITFDALSFSSAGEYTFTVKETKKFLGFIEYSTAVYQVTIQVINTDGVLSVVEPVTVVNTTDNSTGTLEFINTYKFIDEEDTITLTGSKSITGDRNQVKDQEFTFGLYDEAGELVVSAENDENGNFSLSTSFDTDDISDTPYIYTVKEILPTDADGNVINPYKGVSYDTNIYQVKITVSDNGEGAVEASYELVDADAITFSNTYTVDDEKIITLEGTKSITGDRNQVKDQEFTFGLYDEAGELVVSAENDENGNFSLRAEFNESHIRQTPYTYTVKEILPTVDGVEVTEKDGVKYDTTVYSVSITVSDDGEGGIDVAYEITGSGSVSFSNQYNITGTADLELTGTKTVIGDRTTVGENEFTFGLYDDHGDPVASSENNAAGGFSLSTTFDKDDISDTPYIYTVKEILPTDASGNVLNPYKGVTYDTTVYQVEITVSDNGKGGVEVDYRLLDAQELAFTNEYRVTGTAKLELTGTKELTGGKPLADNDFTFGLYLDGAEVDTDSNVDGKFTLVDEYDATELGEYTYEIREVSGTMDGVEYDDTVYTVDVQVYDDTEGGIAVEYTIRGNKSIAFTNIFTPDPVEYTLLAKKTYDKELKGNDFWFELTGKIGDTQISQEKQNDADGNITFDALSFPSAGEYTFTVKETKKFLGFIEYSTAVYQVTIQVINTDGVLSVVEPVTVVNTTDNSTGTLEFINTYKFIDEEDTITLTGSKSITGDRTVVGEKEFKFGLYDEAGELVVSAENDENGNFSLSTSFDTDDISDTPYIYTVKEILPTDADGNVINPYKGVSYDTNIYQVKITVSDNGEGAVEASYELVDADAITFSNTYDAAPVSVNFTGTKTLVGADLTDKQFAFKLYRTDSTYDVAAGTEVAEDRNENGTYAMTQEFDKADTYYYVLVEDAADPITDVVYDTTQYRFQITVSDVGDGQLRATVNSLTTGTVVSDSAEDVTVENLNFTNAHFDQVTKKKVYRASEPDVMIDGRQVTVGEVLTYKISYTNYTGADVQVNIRDKIPAYTEYVEGSASNGGTCADGYANWDLNVAKGDTVTVSFQVKVSQMDVIISNEAEVRDGTNIYTTNEVTNHTDDDPLEKDVFKPADVTTSIDGELVQPGDELLYKLTFTNTTGEAVTAVITDAIPANTSYVEGTATPGGVLTDGVLTWTKDVAAWQTVTLTFKVRVNENAEDVIIHNQAQAQVGENTYKSLIVTNHTDDDPLEKDVFKPADVQTSIDGELVQPGDELSYGLSFTNTTGETVEVTITDAIPANTSYVDGSATNGGVLTDGVLTWKLTVEAWQTVTVSFKVQVNTGAEDVIIDNQAYAVVGENKYTSDVITNHTDDDPLEKDVFKPTDVTISIDGEQVQPGDELLYKLTFTNTTGEAVTAVITDAIPVNTSYVEGTATDGGVLTDGVLTWTKDVAAWQTVTLTFKVRVNENADKAFIENQAYAVVGENKYISDVITNHTWDEEPVKDVFLASEPTVSVDGKEVSNGDELIYTITYVNTTGADAQVTITDTVPANITFVSADNGGVCKDGVVTWTLTVAENQSVTVTMKVKVSTDDVTVKNTATVLVGENKYTTNEVTSKVSKTPETPTVPDNDKTGDNFNIVLLSVLMLASGMGIIITAAAKKRKESEDQA